MFPRRYQLILSVMLVVLAMLVTLSSVVFAGRIHVYEGPEFYTGKVSQTVQFRFLGRSF